MMDDVLTAAILRWLHVLAGIMWIGLLYFFNFVNAEATKQANAAGEGAPFGKYMMPRALFFFRWGAVATWVVGALLLAFEIPAV
ncbi:MAG TPA: urate hydroxylase PuuD, partial [Candidatus Baltobacteraceae bacterium]|nr:urate hydroxylase PuuD [Candidatus Baltobacteraceae bacterium]